MPLIVDEVLRSPGRPLDTDTRDFMEGRFGHDFGEVRVHTDRNAAASASDVHALAYTVGQDVVFGAGRYAPATPEGRKLLAHELVHVVQQGGRPSAPRASLSVGSAQDPAETEAEQVAKRVVAGEAVGHSIGNYGGAIQRQAAPGAGGSGPGQTPSPAAQAGAPQSQQYPDCDRRTARVTDPAGIIEGARATAITWTNAVIPMIGAVITTPESWQGTIAAEHLDRHFHCPSNDEMDRIRTTFQAIGAILPRIPLRCTNDAALCGPRVHQAPVPLMANYEVLLCPEYFTMSANLRAMNMILRAANMLGRHGECYIEQRCYNDFSVPASTMIGNGTTYGYFAAGATNARNYPWPATIPCATRQPATRPQAPLPQPQALCQDTGRITSRTIVFPPPPGRPHVQIGSGPADGILLEERRDAFGNFVCDRERRISQSW